MNAIIELFLKISNIGVEPHLTRGDLRQLRLTNALGFLSLLCTLPFTIIYTINGNYVNSLLCLFVLLFYVFILYANHKKWFYVGKSLLLFISSILLFIACIILINDVKLHYMYFLLGTQAWILYNVKKDKWLIGINILITITLFIILERYHDSFTFFEDYYPVINKDYIVVLNFVIFTIIIFSINVLMGYFAWEYEENDKELKDLLKEQEKDKQQIELTNKELKKSLNELEQLTYASSHDLKTPLRGIISFAQLLKRRYGNQLDEDANEYLDYISKEANRQYEQIEGLLSYLVTNKEEKVITEISTNEVLDSIIQSFLGVIQEEEVTVRKENCPNIVFDIHSFKQIFYNLISNALKFAHSDRKLILHINCEVKENFYIFSITDNGTGFDMKYHDQIFGLFKVLSPKDREQGSGIGLATCKKIIESNGGKIWAKSELNKGSTFYFSIPFE
ncbi:MAG: ATP-binding protein [Saprospiraceae bacterium]